MTKFSFIIVAFACLQIGVQCSDRFLFYETFDDGDDAFDSGRWVKSSQEKYTDQPVMIKPPTKVIPGFEGDKGIQLTQEMKHYGFGAKFTKPLLTSESNEIVIQYELKMEEPLACGGAYVKMLRDSEDLDISALSNETPYSIMFGPDKCGSQAKVHFIVKHQNPVSKEWGEHHFNGDLKPKLDRSTHLYSLLIRNDSSFEITLDTKPVAYGNLLSSLTPPINPPEMVDDPTDLKPSDWEDNEFIPDISALKPADWDDTQPRKIRSGDDSKPADWDETLPALVPDPSVIKPSDWDDEEDGFWEAPEVPNPACEKLSGCGPWTPPMVDNPLYKGKWVPPNIPNPKYKGMWSPRQIKNEGFFVDTTPYYSIASMGALSVEVWTTTAGILFDNFAVTTDHSAAFDFAQETTAEKARAEREALKKEQKEMQHEERLELIAHGTIMDKIQAYSEIAADYLKEHPMIVVDTLIVVIVGLLYHLLFGWTKTKTTQTPAESSMEAAKPQCGFTKSSTAEMQHNESVSTAAVESKDKAE